MVAVCKRAGVTLMTAYRKYFEPSSLALKRLIESKALGKLDSIHTAFSEVYRPGISQSWLVDRELAGGGPLMDLGIYCVNTGRWIGRRRSARSHRAVLAPQKSTFREIEEGIAFQMKFPSGLLLQGTSTYSAELSSFIYVQGDQGWAMLTPAFTFHEPRQLTAHVKGRTTTRTFKVLDEFALEIDAFADAVRSRKHPEPDGIQGHRDIQIAHAIYEAARTNRPITVNYR